jgi:4-hydroxy-tetrahydrodipicolinate synthase
VGRLVNRGAPLAYATSTTPFRADGALDGDALEAHLARLGQAHLGIYVGGSGSGEGNILTPDERTEVLRIARATVGRDVPVRAMGTEPRSSRDMLEHVARAAAAGMDAAQVYPLDMGHGKRPTPAEVETYLRAVLSAAELPLVLVTHRAVGYETPVELLAGLAEEFPAVVGVNWTHDRLSSLVELLGALPRHVEVHVGGPVHAVTVLALGGTGFIATEANVAPHLSATIVDRFVAGDVAGSGEAFATLLRLGALVDDAGGVAATKALLDELGLPGGGPPRDPRLPLAADRAAALAAAVRDLGDAAVR